MNRVFIGGIIALTLVALGAFYLGATEREALAMRAVVGEADSAGTEVNPTDAVLDFGTIPAGAAVTRYVRVSNDGMMKVLVVTQSHGPIADMIGIDPIAARTTLEPGEEHRIPILFSPHESNRNGLTVGTLTINKYPYPFNF